MQFKKGLGWKACYDEERNVYTAQRSWRGCYQLCEIDKEIYDRLDPEGKGEEDPDRLINKGRHLVESDDDYYTSPYVTVFDENYLELAPWSDAEKRVRNTEHRTSKELADYVVEHFQSEEKNREYRRKKAEQENIE